MNDVVQKWQLVRRSSLLIVHALVVSLVLAYQFYFKDLLSNRRRAGGVGGGHRLGGAGSSASATNSVQSEEAREVSLLPFGVRLFEFDFCLACPREDVSDDTSFFLLLLLLLGADCVTRCCGSVG